MKLKKPQFWDKEYLTLPSIILWPISLLYQIVFRVRKSFIKKKSFSKPIICVGNIYLGGTGKTPISIKIFNIFKDDMKPVVIKKKYKNQIDENEMLKKYCKVISDKDRYLSIEKAIDKKFNLLILDDGFQDLTIKKNLNIICFNDRQQIGNGQILPSGPLREDISSLKDCHIILINGRKNFQFEQKLKKYNEKLKFFYFNYIPKNLNEFKNKKLIAFAGIGNPENFFDLLKLNRLNVVKEISFPDHYSYSEKDFEKLTDLEKKYNAKLITTEKDFLRISPFNRRRFGVIYLETKIDDEFNFVKTLKKILNENN